MKDEQPLSMEETPQITRSSQTTEQQQIAELELMVQILQNKLRIFEGSRAIEEDVKLVKKNDTVVGYNFKLVRDILPYLKEVRGYL